jgi:uncharacterized heparinase superfamily protein
MTRDDIIRMFNEAGESAGWRPGLGNALVINYLTHFAALVAAAERERIAALVEQMGIDGYGTLAIAAAIRKGGHP